MMGIHTQTVRSAELRPEALTLPVTQRSSASIHATYEQQKGRRSRAAPFESHPAVDITES
jgi:hypothetical protein